MKKAYWARNRPSSRQQQQHPIIKHALLQSFCQ